MNQSNIFLVVIFSLIGGVLSLAGGVALLFGSASRLKKFSRMAVPFAAGALLGAVFLDLLLEGLEVDETQTVLLATLGGILFFFILERFTHWFHHHHDEDDGRQRSSLLIILADTLHNALDGVAIASAFLISVPTGIVTTIAVAAHEIPQEIGDFGVLLAKGLSKKRVLLANVGSALATVALAVITFVLGGSHAIPEGALLGLSSGFLLYVALSDLIPTIHETKSKRGKIDVDVVLLVLGVAIVAIAVRLAHSYIEH